MRRVNDSRYSVSWDKKRNSCEFMHKNGKGGDLGCGVSDCLHVFSDGGRILVLSINYPEVYACLESFEDDSGPSQVVLANRRDIQENFGEGFPAMDPKTIANFLRREMED